MKRFWKYLLGVLLLLVAVVVGGSLYLLSYSLRPDEVMADKDASAREYIREEYPAVRPWLDSLERTGALRDTTIRGREGERLHALYAAAPRPTDRTAVIVHGYTDCADRMLMVGYLYNHDLGFNILLPDLHYHGRSEGRAIRMGWLDRLDVLRWMEVADLLFGGHTQMVVHGISMGAATTMMVSGEEQQPYVKCFVEDCGYTSVWEQFAKELGERFSLPAFPLLHVADLLCGVKYGWTFREASALEQVKRCRCSSSTAMPTTSSPRGWSIRSSRPSRARRSCGSFPEPPMRSPTVTIPKSIRAVWPSSSAATSTACLVSEHRPGPGRRRRPARLRLRPARACAAKPTPQEGCAFAG